MRASPSLSQLWQPHSRLCQLCRVCEQQRSCSPGFCRKELHATEGAVEVRRARRRLEEAATDERVGLFTPDKDGHTADGAGRVPVIVARRGTVCGEVGRVPRFCSTHGPHPLCDVAVCVFGFLCLRFGFWIFFCTLFIYRHSTAGPRGRCTPLARCVGSAGRHRVRETRVTS